MTVEEILATKTVEQLHKAIAKARSEIAIIDAMDGVSGDDFDGPFPPSKNYEKWVAQSSENLRRIYMIGLLDAENELRRRGYRP